jgi:hypothetical protein
MKISLSLFLFVFLIGCQQKNEFQDGVVSKVKWGSSMDEVKTLYKTYPKETGSDFLRYIETYYMNTKSMETSVKYTFDSKFGLCQTQLYYSSSDSNAMEMISHFVEKIVYLGNVRLLDQENNYLIKTAGDIHPDTNIYERTYVGGQSLLRLTLRASPPSYSFDKGTDYQLTISAIPASWSFRETSSDRRKRLEIH